jgi:AcrR family transcriptional regulator
MRPARPPRSPQPQLSRDQIAAAAVQIADEGGAEEVSMRKVAVRLNCGTMSLYRHVRNKEELLDLMIETILGEDGGPPADPSGDWRADLRRNAWWMRSQARRHPWLLRILPGRPYLGPNMLRTTEFALSAVDGLGLDMDEMVGIIRIASAFVVGFVQNELAEQQWRRPPSDPADEWLAGVIPYIRHIAETGQYPRFTRMIIEAEEFPDQDAGFEWQLQRVLDGIATVVAEAAAR